MREVMMQRCICKCRYNKVKKILSGEIYLHLSQKSPVTELIAVREFYSQVNYPANDIELFKKVINAAADFNKVVLVLEKD